ncbi:MAG: carboxylating nicotinate-nucleotide diphosphorylase [Luteolibacter sp.]|jgi:nicotinate-nucleotide pyrophosphorylase (carboxylating)
MADSHQSLIDLALAEDVGTGDVTSRYFVPADREARAFVTVRSPGVLSGVDLAARVFLTVDSALRVEMMVGDGSRVGKGALVLKIEGLARSILTAERTALNFIQHLSGIATLTARYVEKTLGTNCRILDTRKTLPGYRSLAKRAVVHGGGTNHRMGLYDRAMVKDNHLIAEGGLPAIQDAIHRLKHEKAGVEVELEADSIDQVRAFLMLEGVDYILLDNMTPDELRAAVAARGATRKPLLEASGGVTLETVAEIAATGVDFISVGALTHSAPALDLGLDFHEL